MQFDFEMDAEQYETLLGKAHKHYMRIKCDELFDAIQALKPQRVLDIGCGTGQAEEILQDKVGRLYCMDISANMLSMFRRKGLDECRLLQADASVLPLATGAFDVVFSVALFHHLEPKSWEPAVAEMKRVVRRGGFVVCFEHNPANPVTRYFVARCPIDYDAALISLSELRRLFQQHGIEVLGQRYMVFLPYPLTFLYPVEKALHRFPFGGQYMLLGSVK